MRPRSLENTPGVKCPSCHKTHAIVKDGIRKTRSRGEVQLYRCEGELKYRDKSGQVFYKRCGRKFVEGTCRNLANKAQALREFPKMLDSRGRALQARQKPTLSIAGIARRCKVHRSTVYRWLNKWKRAIVLVWADGEAETEPVTEFDIYPLPVAVKRIKDKAGRNIKKKLLEQGFESIQRLPDGTIKLIKALHPTVPIVSDVSYQSHSERYGLTWLEEGVLEVLERKEIVPPLSALPLQPFWGYLTSSLPVLRVGVYASLLNGSLFKCRT